MNKIPQQKMYGVAAYAGLVWGFILMMCRTRGLATGPFGSFILGFCLGFILTMLCFELLQ